MPAIVIPRRQLVQPQGYARVAEGSWMTYLPSAGINSLLDGRSLSNSGVALAIGNSGVAADIDAAADYLEYTPTTDIPDSFHLVAVVDLNASSTFSRLIQSGDSSGYERFFIWFAPSTSSGSVGNPNSVVIGRNISPSILGERWSTAENSLVRPRSGVVLEVIWGATASDTTAPQVWINGVEQTVTKVQSSASFNADFDTLSGAPLRIGNRFGSVDRALLGKLYLLHVEQQSRTAPYVNPWQLFKAPQHRLYFDTGAGSGSTALTARPLASSATVTRAAVVQTSVTASAGAAASPAVTRAAVAQTHIVTARSADAPSTVTRAAVVQGTPGTVAVAGRAVTAASSVTRGDVLQTAVVLGRDILSVGGVSAGAVTQIAPSTAVLAARDVLGTATATNSAVASMQQLTARGLTSTARLTRAGLQAPDVPVRRVVVARRQTTQVAQPQAPNSVLPSGGRTTPVVVVPPASDRVGY